MKKLYEKNLVENLYQNKSLPYEEMLEFLQSDNFEQKHFALTFINKLEKSDDIKFFIQNLVGEDTKIRELSSFRINDFILEEAALMSFLDAQPEILLRSIDDVNPQVCRNTCAILHLSNNKLFLTEKILEKISTLIENTKTIKFKSHKVNKEIFHLYWSFFALENLLDKDFGQSERLLEILNQSINYKDYTIRERVAFLAKKLSSLDFNNIQTIINILESDENFYVKKALTLD